MNNVSKGLLVLLLFTLGILACRDSSVPENLIEEDEMVEILTELQKTESELSRLNLKSYDSAVVAMDYLRGQILKERGEDTSSYFASYDYYGSRPKEFARIFERVEERLKDLEAEQSEGTIYRKESEGRD
ncbi:DUF4296 domain-containing protein [Jiulongibacter sp. NS-SX5]|uniref:DUF4296 domain-containing protein n=1 Tax=Jiulongibacter sp. NS-SX5 TaxID=3463854 RepID=UPI00405868B3